MCGGGGGDWSGGGVKERGFDGMTYMILAEWEEPVGHCLDRRFNCVLYLHYIHLSGQQSDSLSSHHCMSGDILGCWRLLKRQSLYHNWAFPVKYSQFRLCRWHMHWKLNFGSSALYVTIYSSIKKKNKNKGKSLISFDPSLQSASTRVTKTKTTKRQKKTDNFK